MISQKASIINQNDKLHVTIATVHLLLLILTSCTLHQHLFSVIHVTRHQVYYVIYPPLLSLMRYGA